MTIDISPRCACGRIMQLVPAGHGYWVWSCPVHGAPTYTTSNSTSNSTIGEPLYTVTTSTSNQEMKKTHGQSN